MKGFKNRETKHTKTPGHHKIDFEEIIIPTKNNCTLYGWWIPGHTTQPTVILVHGWGRNVERMMPYIKQLRNDYNLLTFDSRNHGNSDRDKHSTMVKFAEDISSSIDFLIEELKISNREIGIVGLSIGGAAAIYAASNDDRIKSVVTVGAFANPMDIMKMQLKKRHVPYYPVGWVLLKYLEYLVGFRFNDVAPEKNIVKTDASILLIHGAKDETIPPVHAERLKKAGGNKTELWMIDKHGHSDCHDELGYWDRLRQFFRNRLQ